jgi:hypothetical protein
MLKQNRKHWHTNTNNEGMCKFAARILRSLDLQMDDTVVHTAL